MVYQAFEYAGFDDEGGREKDPLSFSKWQKGIGVLKTKGYSVLHGNASQDGIPTAVLVGADPQSPLFSTIKRDFYELVASLHFLFKSSHFYSER